ncbi:MAG: hypothetical protein ABL949_10070 [Fimbriimonadaceae bacterium]
MIKFFTLFLVGAFCNQGDAPVPQAEMKHIFRSLVEISRPSNLEKIRQDLAGSTSLLARSSDGTMQFGSGFAMVNYTARGHFRGYACMLIPRDRRPERPNDDLIAEAKQVMQLLNIWGDTVKYSIAVGPSWNTVTASPFVGPLQCLNDATVRFDARSGALEEITMWDRLDYTRFGRAPRVSDQAALAGAWAAYEGFHPYRITEVGEVRRYIGIPASAELRPPAYHEISEAEFANFRNLTALPLYYFDFVNAEAGPTQYGSQQTVVVNALTGRAIVIYPSDQRGNAATQKRFQLPKSVYVGLRGTSKTWKVVASKGTKPTSTAVWIKLGKSYLDARYASREKLLYLPCGGGYTAYSVTASLAKQLIKATNTRKPFARDRR